MASDLTQPDRSDRLDKPDPVDPNFDLDRELVSLGRMDRKALRARWHREFRRPAPTSISTEKLVRALAYRLQVIHFGVDDGFLVTAGLARISSLTDGAGMPLVLRRSWKGHDHEVIREGHHYLHQGQTYRSLSAVARAITGTRWNGWIFFGLISPSPKDSLSHE